METKKQKRKKPGCCLNADLAVECANQYLNLLPLDKKKLLSKFKEKPQASLLGPKDLVWIVSFSVSLQDPEKCLILYIEIKNSRVHDAYVNISDIKEVENNKRYVNGRFVAYYQDGIFSIVKNSTYMSLQEAKEMWEREKDNHLLRLTKQNFVFFKEIIPTFNEKTPLYMIGYSKNSCDNHIKVLSVYPNCCKLYATSYCPKNWKKMRSHPIGSSIIKANKKIIITEKGFEVELL